MYAKSFKSLIALFACACAAQGAVSQTQYERGVLMELYTGQRCANCPLASGVLSEIVGENGFSERLVWISHHAGYYTDSLTIKESYDLSVFCGINGAPYIVYNRSLQKFGIGKAKLGQLAADFEKYNRKYADDDEEGRTFIAAELDRKADVSVDLTVGYDEGTRRLTVEVFGEKNAEFSASNPALSVFLVQDGYVGMQLVGGQTGFDYEYEHHNPVRKMLSSHYLGDPLAFDGNDRYRMTFDYVIPEKIPNYDASGLVGDVEVDTDPSQMYVVAFISNRDESEVSNPNFDRSNIQVYNAVQCRLGESTASVSEVGHEPDVVVYATDGHIHAVGVAGVPEVYSLTGSRMDGDGQLPSGLYIVRGVTLQGKSFVRKVLVG